MWNVFTYGYMKGITYLALPTSPKHGTGRVRYFWFDEFFQDEQQADFAGVAPDSLFVSGLLILIVDACLKN